jgi:hypothetical protein
MTMVLVLHVTFFYITFQSSLLFSHSNPRTFWYLSLIYSLNMNNRSPQKLTTVGILSPLKCPVCFEYSIGVSIYVCGNGHSVCENCHFKLNKCPTCNGPPPKTRNLGLEELADAVVVSCPFAESGCTQSVIGSKYKQHKSSCSFG